MVSTGWPVRRARRRPADNGVHRRRQAPRVGRRTDADQAILLAAKVLEVNADFYPDGDASARRVDRADERGGSDHGWFDTVQHLIERGHRLPTSRLHPMQVRGFAAATARVRTPHAMPGCSR